MKDKLRTYSGRATYSNKRQRKKRNNGKFIKRHMEENNNSNKTPSIVNTDDDKRQHKGSQRIKRTLKGACLRTLKQALVLNSAHFTSHNL